MQEVKQRLDKVEQRLDKVEQRLDKVEQRLDKVEQRLDKVEQRLDKVEQRLDKVEQRLDKVEQKLDKVEQRLDKVDQKIEYLRLDMNRKYDDLREAIFYLENSLGGKLDAICDFIKVQTSKNSDNEHKFSDFSEKVEKNGLKILNHEERITFLEKKLNQAN